MSPQSGIARVAIVVEHVGIDEERVTLFHANVGEGIERIGGGEEMRGIASHGGTRMRERDIASQHLCSWNGFLVKFKRVGVVKRDWHGLLFLLFRGNDKRASQ